MSIEPLHGIRTLVVCLLLTLSLNGCASARSIIQTSTRSSVANDGSLYSLIANRKYAIAITTLTTLYENFPNSQRDETKFTKAVNRAAYYLADEHENSLKNFIRRHKNEIPVQFLEARQLQYQGIKARGNKFAEDTSKEDKRAMHTALARSIDLYNLVLYKDPSNYLAHAHLALNLSYTAKYELSNEHFEIALDYSPTNYTIWQTFLSQNKPRWGGSHEKMDDIIFALEAYERENPRLTRLKGLALADKADIARRNKKLDLAERFALAALEFEPHKTYGQTVDQVYQAVSRSGDTVAACRISKKVNSIYPTNKRYQKLIEGC